MLTDTRQIGRIFVHPENPDIVYVAAIGHFTGPNKERGEARPTQAQEELFVDHKATYQSVIDGLNYFIITDYAKYKTMC